MPAGSALGPVARQWGDGGNALPGRHFIADIHYGTDASWMKCGKDGAYLQADTPEALENLWLWHGGKVMAPVAGPEPVSPEESSRFFRSRDALLDLADAASRCTCTPDSDITLCVNYVPGDEEPLDDD